MFPDEQLKTIFNKTGSRCYYCGTYLVPFSDDKERYGRSFVIDHFVPRRMGGGNDINNLVPCCWKCNSSKGGKHIDDWRWDITRKKLGMPRFSEEQIDYLASIGFDLYQQTKWHEFYFESIEFLVSAGVINKKYVEYKEYIND